MIVYVGAGSGPFRDLVIDAGHGQMVSRQADAFRIPKRGRWAFDNGAWVDFLHGRRFDDAEYLRRLERIEAAPHDKRPDWCVVPDEVASPNSLLYSLEWKSFLDRRAPWLKWYLAVQDRMSPDDVHQALCLEKFDGLFVGGSTAWKIETSPGWVKFGHDRGLPVHIARVNGPARLQWAVDIGGDSVDGTGWVRAGARWAPWLLEPPVPELRILAPEWRDFATFITAIYSDPAAWRSRFPEDPAEGWEGYDKIAAMGPDEFVMWYRAAYPEGYPLTKELARSVPRQEFQEWKWGIVDETERFYGIRPVPPEGELPRFVIGQDGHATPLGQMLQEGAVLGKCQATGRPLVEWRGCMLPVVAAKDARQAELVAAEQEGRPAPPVIKCPSPITRKKPGKEAQTPPEPPSLKGRNRMADFLSRFSHHRPA